MYDNYGHQGVDPNFQAGGNPFAGGGNPFGGGFGGFGGFGFPGGFKVRLICISTLCVDEWALICGCVQPAHAMHVIVWCVWTR